MVRLAHFKGYRVIDGKVVNSNGKVRKTCIRWRSKDAHTYAIEQVNIAGSDHKSFPIPVHKLVAFQKFGEAALQTGVQVRHANNNSLDNSEGNILIGTGTENALDRPELDRRVHAAKGRQTYTKTEVDRLRKAYDSGESYKEIERRTGISRSTLSYYLSTKAKRTSFTFAT